MDNFAQILKYVLYLAVFGLAVWAYFKLKNLLPGAEMKATGKSFTRADRLAREWLKNGEIIASDLILARSYAMQIIEDGGPFLMDYTIKNNVLAKYGKGSTHYGYSG